VNPPKTPIRSDEEVNRLVNENIRLAYFFARKWEWAIGHDDALSIALEGLLLGAQTWRDDGCPFGTWAGYRIRWTFRWHRDRARAQKRGGQGSSGRGELFSHIPIDAQKYWDGSLTVGDTLADETARLPGEELSEIERVAQNEKEVRWLLTLVSPRNAEILKMRFGLDGHQPHILEDIGRKLNLTRERVRQIEAESLRKFWREKRRKTLEPVRLAVAAA
jgi:RNA polymerase sigma factor (sigma-70 family)